MMRELEGRAALITGASRGIGEAAARVMAEAGMAVALVARSADDIGRIAGELRADGRRAIARACDVADAGEVAGAVARTVSEFGRLDVLVNNAGVIEPIAHLAEADPAAWGRLIDINVKGVFHGMREAARVMGRGGVIVNVSSGAATGALEGWSAYCASKAAVLSLTRVGEMELGPRGIRVVGLSPGTVATGMQATIKASGINPVSRLDPSVHIPAEWAGRAIAWLCSDDAAGFRGEDVSLRDEAIRRRVGLD